MLVCAASLCRIDNRLLLIALRKSIASPIQTATANTSCSRFISHRWVEIRIDERPHAGTAFKESLLFVNDRTVPRGIERLDGESWF